MSSTEELQVIETFTIRRSDETAELYAAETAAIEALLGAAEALHPFLIATERAPADGSGLYSHAVPAAMAILADSFEGKLVVGRRGHRESTDD